MKHPISRAPSLAALGALALLVAFPAQAQAQDSGESLTTLEGVYTEEQARTGRQLFDSQCGLCHTPGEFSGAIFQRSWNTRPVGAFFTQIRGTMPLDNPGSLTAEQYAAVVAYILELNRYPTGERALPADPDSLSRIQFVPAPEDGR